MQAEVYSKLDQELCPADLTNVADVISSFSSQWFCFSEIILPHF